MSEPIESIFQLDEFKPYAMRWQSRGKELARRRSYYDGSIYGGLGGMLGWLGPRVYKGTKALYLPLSRSVDVDSGIVPGGWKLGEQVTAAQQAAMRQVLAWSNWTTDSTLYIHYGAQYGVSGLKVADLRERERVVISPIDPTCFMLVGSGQYDDTPAMALWVERRYGADGEVYEYAEVITADAVRTFVAGQAVGVDGREAEYDNDLGFVPFVEVPHKRTGRTLGDCTYQQTIPLLDEVNELAAYLADIIKKHVEPQWMISGAAASDLVKGGDNVWFLPAGAEAMPLVAGIDIPGVLGFIKEIAQNVKDGLPELAFDELRDKTQIATATLELQLMELVLKIKRSRPNYDHGLADGLRLAGRAGETMGLGELAALDDEGFGFDDERPVLPLDPETAMRLEAQALQLEREKQLDAGGVVVPDA